MRIVCGHLALCLSQGPVVAVACCFHLLLSLSFLIPMGFLCLLKRRTSRFNSRRTALLTAEHSPESPFGKRCEVLPLRCGNGDPKRTRVKWRQSNLRRREASLIRGSRVRDDRSRPSSSAIRCSMARVFASASPSRAAASRAACSRSSALRCLSCARSSCSRARCCARCAASQSRYEPYELERGDILCPTAEEVIRINMNVTLRDCRQEVTYGTNVTMV